MEIQDIEEIICQENLVISNYYMNNLADNYAQAFPSKIMHIKEIAL